MTKIVVIGGTGLIGSQVVDMLRAAGNSVVAASPSSGVDTLTGEGVDEVLAGADVVVDVTNRLLYDADEIVAFFGTSTKNLLEAERRAGVGHHVALSIVGMDDMPAVSYMAGKAAQEKLIREGGVPYTIVRATQFLEFLPDIAESGVRDGGVYISTHLFQPVAAREVAEAVADAAGQSPRNGFVDVAGPERAPMSEFVSRLLAARGDARKVIGDPDAGYFGIPIEHETLVPAGEYRHATTTLDDWLKSQSS